MKLNFFSRIKQTPVRKVLSYAERQEADILKYGAKERKVPLNGITEEEINEIAPHRRLSAKGNTLSDPEWFIKKYEEEAGKDYLPGWWNYVSPGMKGDYIVRQRYYSLLANKIMNKIQKEPVEHSYQFFDGEIIGHAIGDHKSVNYKGSHIDADVHNHPISTALDYCDKALAEFTEKLNPDIRKAHVPHSGEDIVSSVKHRTDSFVVDSNGGKFVFIPKRTNDDYIDRVVFAKNLDECMEPVGKKIDEISQEEFFSKYVKQNKENGGKEPMGLIIKHYDNVGHIIGYPRLGEYRQRLYKSGVLDSLGKYKELN
ncbi:MAG: hypothetical protein K6E29_05805 [Cyanobacteria bacterium RUI128]|nr:hypothetical protein [Cyanobacteria bacterium RUI128]